MTHDPPFEMDDTFAADALDYFLRNDDLPPGIDSTDVARAVEALDAAVLALWEALNRIPPHVRPDIPGDTL